MVNGHKKYCLGKHSMWMAWLLMHVINGRRTDGHDKVTWVVGNAQWGLHNGVEGIVVWTGIKK